MASFCPNCGVCLCTGAVLIKGMDDNVCCSKCVVKKNEEIRTYLIANPTMTLRDLKFLNRKP